MPTDLYVNSFKVEADCLAIPIHEMEVNDEYEVKAGDTLEIQFKEKLDAKDREGDEWSKVCPLTFHSVDLPSYAKLKGGLITIKPEFTALTGPITINVLRRVDGRDSGDVKFVVNVINKLDMSHCLNASFMEIVNVPKTV